MLKILKNLLTQSKQTKANFNKDQNLLENFPENSKYMFEAIRLAKLNLGKTFPNPSVGCVIVNGGDIVGYAKTNIGGSPHAEITALDFAGALSEGADMYVTLEPCSHIGKNPPCADAVIASGIRKVYIAAKDPFAEVNGKGIEALKNANIEVIENFCENEAYEVNKYFFTRVNKNRPYITIKIAASIDGKIALSTGKSKWITSDSARKYVHEMRASNEGILTGIGTVLADDPQMNCRVEGLEKYSPTKFIIDSKLKTPETALILEGEKTYIFTGANIKKNFENAELIKVSNREYNRLELVEIFSEIAKLGYSSILVEAGKALVSDLIKQNLVDEIHLITAPKILGGDGMSFVDELSLQDVPENNFKVVESRRLGDDILTIFQNTNFL